jgi:hypothetical protein
MILHYCEGGDLGKTITIARKNRAPIQESQVIKWMTQVTFSLFLCLALSLSLVLECVITPLLRLVSRFLISMLPMSFIETSNLSTSSSLTTVSPSPCPESLTLS